MDNMGYLIAAYLIAWAALFGYLLWMSGVARSLRAELADLRTALGERERQQGAAERERAASPEPLGAEAPTAASMREVG
jgi:CcmD family protein